MILDLQLVKKLNTSLTHILHQLQNNFISVSSVNLMTDGMRFSEAIEVMLMT